MKIYLLGSLLDVLKKLELLIPKEKRTPQNLYITTALSLYSEPVWPEVKEKLNTSGFPSTQICISNIDFVSLTQKMEQTDIIYFTGGNTFYLLQEIYKQNFDQLLKKWFTKGKIIVAESAGAVVMGPNIEPVKFLDDVDRAPDLKSMRGLSLINFLPLVHYDTEYYRESFPGMLSFLHNNGVRFIPIKDSEIVEVSKEGEVRFF